MSTTTLYAELIVVGTGAAIFILALFYSLFGYLPWFSKLGEPTSIGSALSLIPVISIIYLLGVIITNLSYLLFERLEDWLRGRELKGKHEYGEIRDKLYASASEGMIADFQFRRSKIRICRGWFIDSFLIIVALSIGTKNRYIDHSIARFAIIAVGLLMAGTGVSWWAATNTELDRLRFFDK